MVRLRLTAEYSLEHRAQLFIPRPSAELIDLVADAFRGGQAKHGVERLVGSAHVELGVENQQRFAWGRGANHSCVEAVRKGTESDVLGRPGSRLSIGRFLEGSPKKVLARARGFTLSRVLSRVLRSYYDWLSCEHPSPLAEMERIGM